MSGSPSLEQPVAQPSEAGDAPGQHAPRTLDAAHRTQHLRLMVGDPIPLLLDPQELRRALGYSRSQFWRLERAGAFDDLLVKVGSGVRTYNGARFAELLRAHDGEDGRRETGRRRYFGHAAAAARHAGDPTKRQSHPPRKSHSERSRETAVNSAADAARVE